MRGLGRHPVTVRAQVLGVRREPALHFLLLLQASAVPRAHVIAEVDPSAGEDAKRQARAERRVGVGHWQGPNTITRMTAMAPIPIPQPRIATLRSVTWVSPPRGSRPAGA